MRGTSKPRSTEGQSAESINRRMEDLLFINRASAKSWRRQMVDLLSHATLVNATTLARCRAAREQLAAVT